MAQFISYDTSDNHPKVDLDQVKWYETEEPDTIRWYLTGGLVITWVLETGDTLAQFLTDMGSGVTAYTQSDMFPA